MARDFFDKDLVDSDERAASAGDAAAEPTNAADQHATSSDRMARQKEELTGHVAGAVSEIERLRMRQEALEKERTELEELARKQDNYERGKRDIVEKLDRSLVLLEKEEQQAKQMVELLSLMRSRFKGTLGELRSIREESWSDESFHDELNRALVLVDEARADYKNGLAKIEASSWHRNPAGQAPPPVFEHVDKELHPEKGFGFWLKVGIALTLPMAVVLITLFVINLFLMGVI